MNIESQIIRYYVQNDEIMKEYFELIEIPKKEDIFLIEKRMSRDIADIFWQLGYKSKSDLIKNCNSLRFLQQCVTNEEHKHWYGSFCKDRYCPICSHIKSHKQAEMLENIIQSMQKDNNYKNSSLIFVTLTQKNVAGGELAHEIKKMNSAIKKMLKEEPLFKDFSKRAKDKKTGKMKKVIRKALCQGTVRHLEVTAKYNPTTDRIEYHPHFHMVLLVKKSYWSNKDGLQWSNPKLQKIWRQYMELDYNPNVDIRLVKDEYDSNNSENNVIQIANKKNKSKFETLESSGAIKEISKYSTKESDIIKFNEDENGIISINWNDTKAILKELYVAMKNTRTIVMTGAFKKTKERLYAANDVDDLIEQMTEEDLIQVFKSKCKFCGGAIEESVHRFYPMECKGSGAYVKLNSSDAVENFKHNFNEKVNYKLLKSLDKRKEILKEIERMKKEKEIEDYRRSIVPDYDELNDDERMLMLSIIIGHKKTDVSDQTNISDELEYIDNLTDDENPFK